MMVYTIAEKVIIIQLSFETQQNWTRTAQLFIDKRENRTENTF